MAFWGLAIAKRQGVTVVEKAAGAWHDAHATFYGDMSGGETMRKCRHIDWLLLHSIFCIDLFAYILCSAWCYIST